MTTPNREQHKNRATSPLDGGIDGSQTTLDVDTGSVFPSVGNFRIMVDSEIMLCTSRSTDTLTVVRGQDGTSGASHSDDATVNMIYSQQGLTRLFQDQVALMGYSSQPAFAGVYNDAGTARLTGGDFTWVNQGSAAVNTNGDSLTMRCPTDSGTNLRILSLTPGGGSWTYIAAMRGMAGGDGAFYSHFGIGMRENATGKLVLVGCGASNTGEQIHSIAKWTDHDSLSAFTQTRRSIHNRVAMWFKAEYDGTNIKFYISADGFEWILFFSETKTTFFTTAPDEIVWYGSNYLNSTTRATELVVSLDHWHKE